MAMHNRWFTIIGLLPAAVSLMLPSQSKISALHLEPAFWSGTKQLQQLLGVQNHVIIVPEFPWISARTCFLALLQFHLSKLMVDPTMPSSPKPSGSQPSLSRNPFIQKCQDLYTTLHEEWPKRRKKCDDRKKHDKLFESMGCSWCRSQWESHAINVFNELYYEYGRLGQNVVEERPYESPNMENVEKAWRAEQVSIVLLETSIDGHS